MKSNSIRFPSLKIGKNCAIYIYHNLFKFTNLLNYPKVFEVPADIYYKSNYIKERNFMVISMSN